MNFFSETFVSLSMVYMYKAMPLQIKKKLQSQTIGA